MAYALIKHVTIISRKQIIESKRELLVITTTTKTYILQDIYAKWDMVKIWNKGFKYVLLYFLDKN